MSYLNLGRVYSSVGTIIEEGCTEEISHSFKINFCFFFNLSLFLKIWNFEKMTCRRWTGLQHHGKKSFLFKDVCSDAHKSKESSS